MPDIVMLAILCIVGGLFMTGGLARDEQMITRVSSRTVNRAGGVEFLGYHIPLRNLMKFYLGSVLFLAILSATVYMVISLAKP